MIAQILHQLINTKLYPIIYSNFMQFLPSTAVMMTYASDDEFIKFHKSEPPQKKQPDPLHVDHRHGATHRTNGINGTLIRWSYLFVGKGLEGYQGSGWMILLMEEFLNSHLGCIKSCKKCELNYQPQLVGWTWQLGRHGWGGLSTAWS